MKHSIGAIQLKNKDKLSINSDIIKEFISAKTSYRTDNLIRNINKYHLGCSF